MARITDIFFVDAPEESVLLMKTTLSVSEIPGFIGKAFVQLNEYMKSKGVQALDAPFLRIQGNDPNMVEITAGIAVSGGREKIEEHGDIKLSYIPAGKRIFCYWLGDNADMSALYEDMRDFAKKAGYKTKEGIFEYYLNSAREGVDHLLTKVVMLLES